MIGDGKPVPSPSSEMALRLLVLLSLSVLAGMCNAMLH